MRPVLIILCLLAAAGTIVAWAVTPENRPDGADRVSRASFEASGRTWPLTTGRADLRCYDGEVVTATVNGTEYQLNSEAARAGYPGIDPVWADDPNSTLHLKRTLEDLREAAQDLCDAPR